MSLPRRRVEFLDTSILVELLRVPGVSGESRQYDKYEAEFEERRRGGAEFRLPVAAVLETGRHVDRVRDGHARRDCAQRFEKVLRATLDRTAPWSFAPLQWNAALLRSIVEPLGEALPGLAEAQATKHLEMGDLLIVAEFLRARNSLDRRAVDVDV